MIRAMTWRRFHWLLCGLMVVVTVLRLMSGNIIGAAISLVLAALFGSIAADYPLWGRLKQARKLWRRMWGE